MSQGRHEIDDLFDQALELAPGARAAFLDRACAGDAALRAELEDLLAADAAAGNFLAEPSFRASHAAAVMVGAETVGSKIGSYSLVKEIGDGGFGTVFLAEQSFPVKRQVALKIIKLGMDTRQVIARFEAERQALAMMDHPGIAKVFDAGVTQTGRPFFVMEFVDGVAITRFCDAEQLTLRARLRLFVKVCLSVHHAHQKGIIHRDLKPSNVLASRVDGAPAARIIDFGIAKATSRGLMGGETVQTQAEAFIGTPAYMSPEQAFGGGDIDTRADVYSLGVMLYELLAGVTPFDSRSMQNATPVDLQKIIQEIDPPRPSTRVNQDRTTIATVAANRGAEPKQLRSHLRGELDWIAMKCLEKQRSRRYESAAALANDLQAYLDGKPVAAAPPSKVYQARKFIQRNRIFIGAGAVVMIAMLAGLVASVLAWQRVKVEQQKTLAALRDAELKKVEAETANESAVQVNRFLNEMLASADPRTTRGRELTVENMLNTAASRIAGKFANRPQVEASIRQTIGRTYAAVNKYPQAMEHLSAANEIRKTLGKQDESQFFLARVDLAQALHQVGKFAEANAEWQAIVRDAMRVLASGGDDTVEVVDVLCDSSGAFSGSPQELYDLFTLAAQRRRRVLGENDPHTLMAEEAAAWQSGRLGNLDDALRRLENIYPRMRAAMPKDDWRPSRCQLRRGQLLVLLERDDEGFALCRASMDEMDQLFGTDHPAPINALQAMGELYASAGRLKESAEIFEECLRRVKLVFGESSQRIVTMLHYVANAFEKLGDLEKAREYHRQKYEAAIANLPPDDMQRSFAQLTYGAFLTKINDPAAGEPLLTAAVADLSKRIRADSPMLLDARNQLARAKMAVGNVEGALAESADVHAIAMANTKPADAKGAAQVTGVHGQLLLQADRPADAEAALRATLDRLEATGQSKSSYARATLIALQKACELQSRRADAEAYAVRLQAIPTSQPAGKRRVILTD